MATEENAKFHATFEAPALAQQRSVQMAAAVYRYAQAHYAAEDAWKLAIEARRLEQDCLAEFNRLCPRENQ